MKNRIYSKTLACIFFLLFTMPILSPSVKGNTIYLFWFIPFLDFYFLKEIFNKLIYIKEKNILNKKYKVALILFCILLIWLCMLNRYIVGIKLIVLLIMLTYLNYCKKEKLLKILYLSVNINIFIALVQFLLYYCVSPEISKLVGPTNIANCLYGNYEIETFTNFYPIFGNIIRVSGWSREAGFFASLIICTIVTYILDKDIKKSKVQYALFIIGFIISFSKMSIILLPVLLIIKLSKYINKLSYFAIVFLTIACLILFSQVLNTSGYYNDLSHESITHRFCGYSIVTQMEAKELVFGVNSLENINENIKMNGYYNNIVKFGEVAGISNTFVHYGIVTFLLIILFMFLINMTSTDFVILLLLTINVTLFTSQSFVILAFFIIIILHDNDRKLIGE